jgi:hypothetical protein
MPSRAYEPIKVIGAFIKSDEFAPINRVGKVRWRTKFRDCRHRSEMRESAVYGSADQFASGIFMMFRKARQLWVSGQSERIRHEYRMGRGALIRFPE